MTEIGKLLRDLAHPDAPWELAALLACLVVAFGVCWLTGRRQPADSVWFGRAVVDGLLFPLLALALTYGAGQVLATSQRVVLLKVAVAVLVSLAGIRFLARVLTVVFPSSGLARLVERLFSWMAWAAAVLWIVGLLPAVMDEMETIHIVFGKSRVSLLTMVQGLLTAGVVLVLALWVSAELERRILRETVNDLSLRKVASNAMRALLLLVGLLFALSAVGVDLTALSVLGGALGVGLGLGLQKLAANYVSGFVILFERSVRIGDMIKVDGFEGTVVDIKTRYTLLRSLTGREAIVPNDKLVTERVENLSLGDPSILVTTGVTVDYDSDTDRVAAILENCAQVSPRVLKNPAPGARLTRLAPDGLEYELLFWIADPHNGQLNVRSEINTAVLKALRAEGIGIPSAPQVVHLRPVPGAQAATSSAKATTG